jgi:hypothetical protein
MRVNHEMKEMWKEAVVAQIDNELKGMWESSVVIAFALEDLEKPRKRQNILCPG